jgi:hypothetical protein
MLALASAGGPSLSDDATDGESYPTQGRLELREMLVNRKPAIDGPARVVDPEETEMDALLLRQTEIDPTSPAVQAENAEPAQR